MPVHKSLISFNLFAFCMNFIAVSLFAYTPGSVVEAGPVSTHLLPGSTLPPGSTLLSSSIRPPGYPCTQCSNQFSAINPLAWPSIALQLILPTASLNSPTHLTHAGDGSGRIFIVEQAGRILIYQNGALLDTPFLDISERVLSPVSGGYFEEGLLSVAFPPGYSQKGYFYVYYTQKDGNNRVARFSLTKDPNVADSGNEKLVLLIEHPDRGQHNGGQMAYGPDGYLYIGVGDGEDIGGPKKNAQNLSLLLGKLLRIDTENTGGIDTTSMRSLQEHSVFLPMIQNFDGSGRRMYHIPPSNPFLDQVGARPEIWAYGLRNPWRFSFDRSTGELYIGDVGQDAWEEVDFQPASSPGGENYGWSIIEGNHCYPSDPCDTTGLTLPIAEYPHEEDNGPKSWSITGGFVYRGPAYPNLQGIYFYTDWAQGILWGLQQEAGTWQSQMFLDTDYQIASFGEDQAGELYFVAMTGELVRVVEAHP